MEPSPELEKVMLRMYDHYSAGNTGALTRLSSRQPGVLAIGTDPGEWWEGYEPIARATEEFFGEPGGAKIRLEAGHLTAFEEGTVGWAADTPRLILPNGREVAMRLTVVFHREDGEWRIVQQHSSIGVPNAEALS